MAPQTVDPETLDHLKREATTRAEALGHRLQVFRTAKHDPLCYVSFCAECRQMVIVSLEHVDDPQNRAFFGYALESRCPGRADAAPALATAESQ